MEVSRPAGRVLRAIARSQFLRRRQGHSPALLSLTARLAAERNTKKEPSRISSLLDLLQYISNSLVYAAEAESGYRRTQQPQVHNQEQPTNQSNPIQSICGADMRFIAMATTLGRRHHPIRNRNREEVVADNQV
jgi:hypothetical protein